MKIKTGLKFIVPLASAVSAISSMSFMASSNAVAAGVRCACSWLEANTGVVRAAGADCPGAVAERPDHAVTCLQYSRLVTMTWSNHFEYKARCSHAGNIGDEGWTVGNSNNVYPLGCKAVSVPWNT